ncbi:MAG: hypothetical protein ACYCYF_00555, partial [Anaerolineae bacterium]
MGLRKSSLMVLGALIGVAVCRCAARAWENARESARPYAKPTLAGAPHLIEIVRGFWRHPEALAMMRSNPEISAPLTDAVLASVLQGGDDGQPSLADRTLAWLSLRGERLHGRRASAPTPLSRTQEALAADLARATLARGGEPAPDLLDDLIAAFGTRTAHDLVTYVRMVTAYILVANTWEALVSRMLGKPAPHSRLEDELQVLSVAVLGVLPLVPVAFVRT